MKATKQRNANKPKLAEFMCFAIYSANLAYGRAYKPILEKLGLTYTQFIVLVALAEEDNQTLSELGAKLLLESNTLTPVLKKLAASGYVSRHRDPTDERQLRISLTAVGRELHNKSMDMSLVAASGLTPSELKQVQATVMQLRENLLRSTKAVGG